MGHQGHQGWIFPIHLLEHTAIIAHIVYCRLGIPQHGAFHIAHVIMELHLGRQLVDFGIVDVWVFRRAFNILANIQIAFVGIPVPPFDQRRIVGCRMAYLPIQLGHAIIYPSIVHPHQHIGIQVVVVLQSVGIASHRRSILLVTIDTKG